MSSVVAVIRASALQHNLAIARSFAPDCPVMAVIKANAYGHGMVGTAKILTDADALAVARMQEAVRLREAGVKSTVVCLSGFNDRNGLALARKHRVQPVIHARHQVELLEATESAEPLSVWLKIDSGMGRLGIAPADGPEMAARLSACAAVTSDVGLMTHLACADDPDDTATNRQIETLGRAMGDWDGDVSIANSAGILGWPDSTGPSPQLRYRGRNWVRPGLMLYGVSPFVDRSAADLGLRPAMSLQAPVISVRDLKAGQAVGYGATWRAEHDCRIAVIAVGYGDGVPWRSSGGTVGINGSRALIVGRISMDLITADITCLPGVTAGDTAVLWGDEATVEGVAQRAGTIPYEVMTGVTDRVRRTYVD